MAKAIAAIAVVVSCLLMAAHVLRSGQFFLAGVCVGLPVLLWVRRGWVRRLLQVALVVAAAEWVRTLVALAAARRAAGEPWARMAVILGAVAAWTVLSAALLELPGVRRRYQTATARGQSGGGQASGAWVDS